MLSNLHARRRGRLSRGVILLILLFTILFCTAFYTIFRKLVDLCFVGAATDGNVVSMQILRSLGANVNARDHGRTALMFAVERGNTHAVQSPLEMGADANDRYEDDANNHTTVLMAAIVKPREKVIHLTA